MGQQTLPLILGPTTLLSIELDAGGGERKRGELPCHSFSQVNQTYIRKRIKFWLAALFIPLQGKGCANNSVWSNNVIKLMRKFCHRRNLLMCIMTVTKLID